MRVETIIGPPGTGKTSYLSRQLALAVDAGETPTVVSLTKAAAEEVRGRVRLSRQQVSTLHSQAYRVLEADGVADTPENLTRWNEAHPNLRLSGGRDLDEDNADANASMKTAADELMSEYQIVRGRMIPRSGWSEAVRRYARRREAWKQAAGLLDFTDLIEQCLLHVDAAPGEPTVLFVDEAQDMSWLEMALIMKWGAAAGRVVLVGDPWQNLYEWRGTDPDVMGEADRVLSRSYRIPRAVHECAMRWIRRMRGYRPIDYQPRDADGAVRRLSGDWRHPETVMSLIGRDVNDGKTVMVLASCEYMIRPLVDALREQSLAFYNPYRLKSASWNPLRRRQRVLSFLAPSRFGTVRLEDVLEWSGSVTAKVWGIKRDDIAMLPTGAEGTVDLGVLADVLRAEAMDALLSGDLHWLASNVLKKRGMEYAIQIASKRGPEDLEKDPQIIVGTIHSVKGSEADSVYVFPDLSRSGWASFVDGSASVFRQFYVALTRARETLTIFESARRRVVPV